MKTRLLLLLVLFNGLLYAQYPITNLVGAYELNGDLTDQANGVNMTLDNGFLLYPADRFATPGSSASLLFGDASRPDIDFIQGGFLNSRFDTVVYNFWVNTSLVDTNRRSIIEDSDRTDDTDADYDGYFVYLKDGKIGARASMRFIPTGYTNRGNEHTKVIADGEWHNINIEIYHERDGLNNEVRLFINITVDGDEEPLTSTINRDPAEITTTYDTVGNIVIGNNRAGNMPVTDKYTNGIDNLLIYSDLITQTEIEGIIDFGNYCQKPDSSIISVTAITNDGATINISDSGTYDLAYHIQGEPFASATIVNNVTTSHVLNGLEANLNYEVYLREVCAVTTIWSESVSFKTDRPTGIVYVNPSATGLNTGTSWANAFTDLQTALDDSRIDESVWLVGGTYKPTVANGDRTIAFTINSRINVLGGFAGTEAAATERVYGTNETILSGDLNGDDDANIDPLNTLRAENSYRVLVTNSTVNGINVGVKLDRLTITGGNANGTGVYNRGGAITKGAITRAFYITDCTIINNSGLNRVVDTRVGGGGAGNITITRSKFINNYSRGGAFYCFTQTTTTVNVLNSLFQNNTAADISGTGQAGSSIWLRSDDFDTAILNVRNSTFVDNQDLGTDTGYNNFNRCTIVLQRSISNGGTPSNTNADIYNSIFYNNTTIGGNTAKLISGGLTTIPGTDVFNSIDENGFSQLDPARVNNSISSNPMFANAATGDYSLAAGSPAIDSGDNAYVLGPTDLADNARVFNSTVDMGAYEYSSTLSTNTFELTKNEIKLYPNPTTSVLNIKMNQSIKQATIYSMLGKEVLRTQNNILDISGLSNGVYVITIEAENGNISTKRFIKK